MELQKELLLLNINKDGQVVNRAIQILIIKQDNLVNNLVKIKSGWNFFKNKRNIFKKVKREDWLSNQII